MRKKIIISCGRIERREPGRTQKNHVDRHSTVRYLQFLGPTKKRRVCDETETENDRKAVRIYFNSGNGNLVL